MKRSALAAAVMLTAAILASTQASAQATIPSVGCAKGGQTEETPAPSRDPVKLDIDPAIAVQLAHYRAIDGPAVLAPRGWECYTTHGSSGIGIQVRPRLRARETRIDATEPYAGQSFHFADTSGRFAVARLIARFFPQRADFVRMVIAEGIEPASNFPEGPWPDDKLVYRSSSLVEFETPPGRQGMGSEWLGGVSDMAVRGLVRICDDGVYVTAVRLPLGMQHLSAAIIGPIQPSIEPDACDAKVG